MLGLVAAGSAQAATVTYTGNFTNDASVFSDPFTTSSSQVYTFTTTSYASGGIVPVLSLFNVTTGKIVDYSGVNTGFSDVSITDTLAPGSYVLDLTEFPNSAVGNLAVGFYPNSPTITGIDCGVTGGMFYNDITCAKTTSNYALIATNAAATTVTPEPSSILLVLPAAAYLFSSRRRRA